MLIGRIMSGCQNLIGSYLKVPSITLINNRLICCKIGSSKTILYCSLSYQQSRSYVNWVCMCKSLKCQNYYKRNPLRGPIEYFSSYTIDLKDNIRKEVSKKKSNTNEAVKKPKKEIKTYITLFKTDGSMEVTTLEEAVKLASRRNFKLVKSLDLDSKTGRAVYNMVTESQYLKEDDEWQSDTSTKKETSIKSFKVVSMSSNINENDLRTKVKLMKKWIEKKMEVRVVISGEKSSGENVYSLIEKELGQNGRILQKRFKGNDIRFQVVGPQGCSKKP